MADPKKDDYGCLLSKELGKDQKNLVYVRPSAKQGGRERRRRRRRLDNSAIRVAREEVITYKSRYQNLYMYRNRLKSMHQVV